MFLILSVTTHPIGSQNIHSIFFVGEIQCKKGIFTS